MPIPVQLLVAHVLLSGAFVAPLTVILRSKQIRKA
jgi:hypothetical protein